MNNTQYLAHYGVEGQKWGVRRYQNKDGTSTKEGKKRTNIKRSVVKTAKKGKLFIDRKLSKKTLNGISTAAKITSGSLFVASLVTTAVIGPTAIPISAVASAVNGIGTVTGTASAMINVDDKK